MNKNVEAAFGWLWCISGSSLFLSPVRPCLQDWVATFTQRGRNPSHFPSWTEFWGGHSITISLLDEGLEGHAIIFNDTDEHICCSLEPFTFLDIHFSCCAPDLKLVIQAPFPPQELLSFILKLQHVSIDFPTLFPTFLYKKSILRSLQVP